MARSMARAAAMQLIYEKMLGGSGESTLNELINFVPEDGDQAFIDAIFAGVSQHEEELDEIVRKFSPSRTVDRIAKVDLAILRIALYELKYDMDTPQAIAINEAVDLAKKFSEPASARFINGVLGSAMREGQEAEA